MVRPFWIFTPAIWGSRIPLPWGWNLKHNLNQIDDFKALKFHFNSQGKIPWGTLGAWLSIITSRLFFTIHDTPAQWTAITGTPFFMRMNQPSLQVLWSKQNDVRLSVCRILLNAECNNVGWKHWRVGPKPDQEIVATSMSLFSLSLG